MLENGEDATLRELAKAERLDAAYVSRMLKLTLLAPELVEAAVNGSQKIALDLRKLTSPFSPDWQHQARLFKDPDGLNGLRNPVGTRMRPECANYCRSSDGTRASEADARGSQMGRFLKELGSAPNRSVGFRSWCQQLAKGDVSELLRWVEDGPTA